MHTTRLWTPGGVLDHDHVLALRPEEAELADRRGAVRKQPGLVVGIGPGAGHDLRPVAGSDAVLVGVDHRVELGGIDHLLLDEDRLQRAHPQRDVVGHRLVIVGRGHAVRRRLPQRLPPCRRPPCQRRPPRSP